MSLETELFHLIYTPVQYELYYFIYLFSSAGDQTEGLAYSKQVLYHWPTSSPHKWVGFLVRMLILW
jgi:hypothetical protein